MAMNCVMIMATIRLTIHLMRATTMKATTIRLFKSPIKVSRLYIVRYLIYSSCIASYYRWCGKAISGEGI